MQIDGGSLDNAGVIIGGAGGRFGGGVALAVAGGSVTNTGTLIGGFGSLIEHQNFAARITGGGITNLGVIEGAQLYGTGPADQRRDGEPGNGGERRHPLECCNADQ